MYSCGWPAIVTLLSSTTTFTFSDLPTVRRAASALSPSIWLPSEPSITTALPGFASATPFTNAHMCPRRPELKWMPGVRCFSGWPGSLLSYSR